MYREGLTDAKSLVCRIPDDPGAWKVDDEYLFGSQILVAPCLNPV